MAGYFDRLETRDPEARIAAQFKALRTLLKAASAKAPALRKRLLEVDLKALKGPADLAPVPVLRKSDLKDMQTAQPPFAGFATLKPGAMGRLFMSPGPIAEPEGVEDDPWGAARSLYAAGFRRGDVVLNTFGYHLTPGGFILDSGARALGCGVIPAGPGQTEQQLEAIRLYQPNAYTGTPDFLKILLDRAAEAGLGAPFKRAVVSGAAFPPSLQADVKARGVDAYQAYATADLGVIAYESPAREGLIVNETLIVEILRPGTGDAVAPGEVGEVVVTRLDAHYPLLRFATGDLSRFLAGTSACGRTNARLAGWLGRADQTTKVKGMFVHPGTIADVMKRHPEIKRVRLVVSRSNETDVMTLHAETGAQEEALSRRIGETLQALTKLKGTVALAAPGALPNDGKIISDERPVG